MLKRVKPKTTQLGSRGSNKGLLGISVRDPTLLNGKGGRTTTTIACHH